MGGAGGDDGDDSAAPGASESSSLAFLRDLAHASDRTPSALGLAVGAAGELLDADQRAIASSGRFAIQRRLGAGGFGTVYEAIDRDRDATVALKVLRRRDPRSLAHFKTEFRSLVETVHDNLVQLYELHAADGAWFFTMELVRGDDALTYMRPGGVRDERRVRSVFRQLAEALSFLHRTGKLHRDVKPSNVMVTDAGRVVVVDFGLVSDLADVAPPALVVGTPAYMAPEQAAGLAVAPSADWYAVGVMLYQALTGQLPARDLEPGSTLPALGPPSAWPGLAATAPADAAHARSSWSAAPPSAITAVPADLERLCLDLLAPIPARRPTGRELRRRLAAARSASDAALVLLGTPPRSAHAGGAEHLFLGREAHLARLDEALAAADDAAAVAVLLPGSSGMGKSALVHQFLADVRGRDPDRLVLFGRCFAQESAPYKGVDGVIDELDRRLRERPAATLPADVAMLARLFPQLRGLARARPPDIGVDADADVDGPQHRQRAFLALRELLAQCSTRAPVLVIDDLQWGDLDGTAALAALLHDGARAPILLITTYRAEDAASNPVLRAFVAALAALADRVDVRRVEVGALDAREAEALSRSLLAADRRPGETIANETVAALIEEAGGDPFLLTELTRHRPGVAGRRDLSAASVPVTMGIGALLTARIDALLPSARQLLEVVALAGQPIAVAVAVHAVDVGGAGADALAAISVLRAGRLIRSGRTDAGEELLPYHDRVRELVVRGLDDAAARGHHHRLATALEDSGATEPERLLFHTRSAGRLADARRHATDAAGRAHAALAFDRAARLYRDALALGAAQTVALDDRALRLGLAEALAGAGRPHEAALAYLDAAQGATAADALARRRRAAELLVGAGYVDEGLAALRDVLRDVDVALPSSLARSLVSFAALRLRLRVRGLAVRERAAATIDERDLLRIDSCYATAVGLFTVNPILAAGAHARHLLVALDAGEPFRVARALFFEAVMVGFLRGQGPATDRLLATAGAIERRLGDPYLTGFARLCECWLAMSAKRWRRVHDRAVDSEALLRRCTGVSTELDFARLARTEALWRLGDVAELIRVVPALVEEARERGNRYLETMVRLAGEAFVGLADDRPDRARASVAAALDRWPRLPGSILHSRTIRIRARIALYEGHPAEALATIDAGLSALRRTGLALVPAVTGELRVVRAFAALSVGDDARAARYARAASGLGSPWAEIVDDVVTASALRRAGDLHGALGLLGRAETAARAHDACLFATAMARRHADWSGATDERAVADAWMAGQGIADPARMTGMLLGWA